MKVRVQRYINDAAITPPDVSVDPLPGTSAQALEEESERAKRAKRRGKMPADQPMKKGGKKTPFRADDPDGLHVAAWLRNIDDSVHQSDPDPLPVQAIMKLSEAVSLINKTCLIVSICLRQLTFQKLAKARKLAQDIAGMDSGDEIVTRAQAHINELEALLYSRAATKPRPKRDVTDQEKNINQTDLTGMSGKQLAYTAASKLTIVQGFI